MYQNRIDQKLKVQLFYSQNQLYLFQNMTQKYHKWSDYEDQSLIQTISKCSNLSWKTISHQLKIKYQIIRTTKQCRERWTHHLNKLQPSKQWTNQQNQLLINLHSSLGSSWTQIISYFPTRCQNDVKNHFYSLVRKSLRHMCQYADLKTSEMNLDQIKPVTLSRVMMFGRKVDDLLPESGVDPLYGILSKADFQVMSQIIASFIINSYKKKKADKCPIKKQKILKTFEQLQYFNSLIVQNSLIHRIQIIESITQKNQKLQNSATLTDLNINKSSLAAEQYNPQINEISKINSSGLFLQCFEKFEIYQEDQNDQKEFECLQEMKVKQLSIKCRDNKNNADSCSIDLSGILNSQLLKNFIIINKDMPINDRQMCKNQTLQYEDLSMQYQKVFQQLDLILESQSHCAPIHEMRQVTTPSIKCLNYFEQQLKRTSSNL